MADILVDFTNSKCSITHTASKSKITTDMPEEFGGIGLSFCSTDLILAALGSCIINTIKNTLSRDGLMPENIKIELNKQLSSDLSKIINIDIRLIYPNVFSDKTKKKLLNCIKVCPVKNSLNSDIKLHISFCNK